MFNAYSRLCLEKKLYEFGEYYRLCLILVAVVEIMLLLRGTINIVATLGSTMIPFEGTLARKNTPHFFWSDQKAYIFQRLFLSYFIRRIRRF